MSQQEIIDKIVFEFFARLEEHSESIRLFITYKSENDSTNTISYTQGSGNYYFQYGQIKEWLLEQDQNVKTFADIKQRKSLND